MWQSSATANRRKSERLLGLSVFLLAEAQSTQRLAVLSAGDVTYAFALPLISGDRCHALLCGTRDVRSSVRDTDKQGLATVGVVAATLLEDALARDELQELDVRGASTSRSPHTSCGARWPASTASAVTLDEREDELAEPQRRVLLNALLEQAARIQNLAEQLLDLSRLDLAAIRISPEPVRLRPKIEELVHSLTEGSNAVTVAVPADLHAVVDPAGLDRMVSNLVANSMRHGKPPVTVTAAGGDRHLRLVVEDRGDGVPPEFVPRLFDRFARSPDSRRRGEGSGLGLSIVQEYARAHGGDIVYEPAVPHGARFEVVIPLRAPGTAIARPALARRRADLTMRPPGDRG